MAQYRKLPVIVHAHHWGGTAAGATPIIDWILSEGGTARYEDEENRIFVKTLEGVTYASPWDWIIKGTHGEFYPCKPNIFESTYEFWSGRGNGMKIQKAKVIESEVRCVRLDRKNLQAVAEWVSGQVLSMEMVDFRDGDGNWERAYLEDWIVQRTGRFSTYKHEVFNESFEVIQ